MSHTKLQQRCRACSWAGVHVEVRRACHVREELAAGLTAAQGYGAPLRLGARREWEFCALLERSTVAVPLSVLVGLTILRAKRERLHPRVGILSTVPRKAVYRMNKPRTVPLHLQTRQGTHRTLAVRYPQHRDTRMHSLTPHTLGACVGAASCVCARAVRTP